MNSATHKIINHKESDFKSKTDNLKETELNHNGKDLVGSILSINTKMQFS